MADKSYPRMITPIFKPFDPVELAEKTCQIVAEKDSRKYTEFYCAGVYGGISTGYLVGCCLRCIYCWVGFGRDFPERYGEFYSPRGAAERLLYNARKKNVKKLRISGGEPTLCREHLMGLLNNLKGANYLFILETNGILLGHDKTYVQELSRFDNIHVRVSIKAGCPEGFEKRTGAKGEFYNLPFKAIEHLLLASIPFHVACMNDQNFMDDKENAKIIEVLSGIGYKGYFEEEVVDLYPASVERLIKAGYRLLKP